jgi:hypothetical protein
MPDTMESAGTERLTMAPAPTTPRAPMVTPANIIGARADPYCLFEHDRLVDVRIEKF